MEALIEQLNAGQALSPADVAAAVADLADPESPEERKVTLLRALRDKGETPEEIAAFASALLDRAVDLELDPARMPGPMIDVCGTGGDRLDLFNVSTTAMFIVAAGGAVVVKHGNRGVSSRCGGADVLEALGIRTDMEPAETRRCLEVCGLAFLFAQRYHPAFKTIAPVRARLAAEGRVTVFNLLGPLLNPARPQYQVVGVFSPDFLQPAAEALRLLGRSHAWVVHGRTEDGRGMDELSTLGPSRIVKARPAAIGEEEIDPGHLSIAPATIDQLAGGDPARNAEILVGILDGSIRDARRDIVALNAAAAFVVAGLARDLPHGIALALAQIASGGAWRKMETLRAFR